MASPTRDVIVPISGMIEEAESLNVQIEYEEVEADLVKADLVKGEAESLNVQSEHDGRNVNLHPQPMWKWISLKQKLARRLASVFGIFNLYGKLAYVVATVVLLGDFLGNLKTTDFWLVSILIAMAAFRIHSRGDELTSRLFRFRNSIFYQVCSAVISVALSLTGEVIQNAHYYDCNSKPVDKNAHDCNSNPVDTALGVFYYLCLVEGIGAVLEKILFTYLFVNWPRLFSKDKSDDSFLHEAGWRYFSHTYLCSINENVFEEDIVLYSVELLQSRDADEQLTGARVLLSLAKDDSWKEKEKTLVERLAERLIEMLNCKTHDEKEIRIAEKTLRTIGTRPGVVEWLIEMLNWKNQDEQKIRIAAAEIISILVDHNQNHIRVASIVGSTEAIMSLLPEITSDNNNVNNQSSPYDSNFSFCQLGLKILKSLAKDYANCAKIESVKGLLPRIKQLTELNPSSSESEIETAMLAQELVKMLASSAHST